MEKVAQSKFNGIIAAYLKGLRRDMDIYIHYGQLDRLNTKKPSLRHIITKLSKVKDKDNSKCSKKQISSYMEGNTHQSNSGFHNRSLQKMT
jgi:hypothetical protein